LLLDAVRIMRVWGQTIRNYWGQISITADAGEIALILNSASGTIAQQIVGADIASNSLVSSGVTNRSVTLYQAGTGFNTGKVGSDGSQVLLTDSVNGDMCLLGANGNTIRFGQNAGATQMSIASSGAVTIAGPSTAVVALKVTGGFGGVDTISAFSESGAGSFVRNTCPVNYSSYFIATVAATFNAYFGINDTGSTDSIGVPNGYVGVGSPNGVGLALTTAGTAQLTIGPSGGVIIGSPTGGNQGSGTINATGLYVNSSPIYPGAPCNVMATSNPTVTLANANEGWETTAATLTFTIPANSSVAFPVGTMLTWFNGGGGTMSIAITTDTLQLANSSSTGTRSIAANGLATAYKVTATKWVISGAGVT
jgi:hypothetical protein